MARSRAAPAAMVMLSDWGVAWGVLGVSRLHYTLATGGTTSKSGAGRHALAVFPPRWHRVVNEALRCRSHPPSPPAVMDAAMARRDEATAFMEFAIATAHSLPTLPDGLPDRLPDRSPR